MELIVGAVGLIFAAVAVVVVVAALCAVVVGVRFTWDVLRDKPWRS